MEMILFDDAGWMDFFPITMTRSTSDLLVGMLTLRERISSWLESEDCGLIVDESLAPLYEESVDTQSVNRLPDGEVLLVNSRLRIDEQVTERIRKLKPGQRLMLGETCLAVRLKTTSMAITPTGLDALLASLEEVETLPDARLWEYPWQLISENGAMIEEDFRNFFYEEGVHWESEPGVTLMNPYDVWIGEGTRLSAGVVLDASGGPVVIDSNVVIGPNSVVIGPAYIGPGCRIRPLSRVCENTSLGPVCKIGGEVEDTIIIGYSNKQHDGFLGHSYLGSWVNLGADTNNSDLKNTYKPVKMWSYRAGKQIDTETVFLGVLIGDHSKTGINCSINTGTVIGPGCNLYGSPLISGFIPGFSWGMADQLITYQFDKFLETAAIVKSRRKQTLTAIEEKMLARLHSRERKRAEGMKS